MIKKCKGFETFEVSCDSCSGHISVETDDFNKAIEQIKYEGWIVKKEMISVDDWEWSHYCPACIEEKKNHSKDMLDFS